MVKLSRTSFGFLGFNSLTSVGLTAGAPTAFCSFFAAALTMGLLVAFGVAVAADFAAVLPGTLAAAFLAAGLITGLLRDLAGAATFLAGLLTTFFATALTAAARGDTGTKEAGTTLLSLGRSLLDAAGTVAATFGAVDDMVISPEVKEQIQFILFIRIKSRCHGQSGQPVAQRQLHFLGISSNAKFMKPTPQKHRSREIALNLALPNLDPSSLAKRLAKVPVLAPRKPTIQHLHSVRFDMVAQILRKKSIALRARRVSRPNEQLNVVGGDGSNIENYRRVRILAKHMRYGMDTLRHMHISV